MVFDKRRSIVLLIEIITSIGIANCSGASSSTGSASTDLSDANGTETINENNEVISSYCAKDEECNDGVDCTADTCLQGNCKYIPDNGKCGAGQICDIAKAGCVKAKSCFSNEDCNDYLKCTVEGCDPDTHTCQYIYDDSRCPDGYICFVPPAFFTTEEYENSIDETSGCSPTKRCKNDNDCVPEETSCAIGTCIVDICVYSPDFTFCDDDDVCNGLESCFAAGIFDGSNDCETFETDHVYEDYCSHYHCNSSQNPLTCNDNNHCTDDYCDHQNGCVFTNNNKFCEDGEICTEYDHCEDGTCTGGSPKDCNDKNPCTDDYCKSGASPCQYYSEQDAFLCGVTAADTLEEGPGCNSKHTMEGEGCDTPCIKNGICSSGECSEGTLVDCDDKNPCTQDSCDSLKGCVNKSSTEPCDPKYECVSEVDCNDSISCTEDFCNNYVCSHEANDSLCDDGYFCNGKEYCDFKIDCQNNTLLNLDDSIACTIDKCDENSQTISHTPNDSMCNDSDFCNGQEWCDSKNGCQFDTPLSYNDNLICTTDTCDSKTGEQQHQIIKCPKGEICNYKGQCQISDCGDISGLQVGAAWPMFGFCPTHHHRSPFVGSETATLKWTFKTDGGIESSPAVSADGTIYVGSKDKNLYAINPDGTEKWTYWGASGVMDSSPAIGLDGTIYSANGFLYAINPDGTNKWVFMTPAGPTSSPTISPDGTIYVNGGNLYAINPDGTKKWSFQMQLPNDLSSPAIGADGTIYVGAFVYYSDCDCNDGKLYAINPNGTKKWDFPTSNPVNSSPAIGADGTIYLGVEGDDLYAINPDGTQKWTSEGDYSPGLGENGTIYVGSYYGLLFAIDPDSTIKWTFESWGKMASSLTIGADGTIYTGTYAEKYDYGYLHAINPDGSEKWTFKTDSIEDYSITSSPALGGDGTIYIGSADGNLYAIGQ